MDETTLFLYTLDDIESRMRGEYAEYEVLQLSGLLRMLLADERPLVHRINRDFQLRIRFEVGDEALQAQEGLIFASMQDGLDPDTSPPHIGSETLTLDHFLAKVISIVDEHEMTVLDIIKFAANVAGGIHSDTAREDAHIALEREIKRSSLGQIPFGTRDLQAIARVTTKGLQPLREAVEAALSGTTTDKPGDDLRD